MGRGTPTGMSRIITLFLGAAIGAAAAHFLDRESGARRRNVLRDQALAKARKGKQEAVRQAEHVAGKAKGAAVEAVPSMPGREEPDDVTLAHKVETEIFRDAAAPKGDVSVDVQKGVVNLRGTVDDEQWIARLAEQAEQVDGVKGVNNLLHRPGTPAPSS
jgi:osmotically-inducible protein OsmY